MVRELCPCIFGAGFFDSYEEKNERKRFLTQVVKTLRYLCSVR